MSRTGVPHKGSLIRRSRQVTRSYLLAVRERGLGAASRRAYSRLLMRAHYLIADRFSGDAAVDATSEFVAISDLSIDNDNWKSAVDYEPTPSFVIRWLIEMLPSNRADWTFVDVGAGKGRVVVTAFELGFGRSLGIEFSNELCEEAKRTLDSLGLPDECGRVRVEHLDATEFEIPSGPCIFYLFNPFGADVINRFLDNVLASHASEPRPMRFIYLNPAHKSEFEKRTELNAVALPNLLSFKLAVLSPYSVAVFETTESGQT